jgi:integrase/recombinase XerD
MVWSLRKFGAFLTIRGHLAVDPAAELHHPKISPRANLPEFLDEHELRGLLTTTAESGVLQDFVLLSLLVSTGMRPHEVAALSFGDVDCDGFCIHHRVKGGWRKQTALNQSMGELLSRWKAQRGEVSDQAPVFLNSRGGRAEIPWIQARVKELGRAARLSRRLTPKMLRHSFATHAADRNGRVMTKALLGHSTLRRTMAYLHLCPTMYRNLMQKHPFPQQVSRGKRRHARGRHPDR